jgi:hypothetical protein
MSGLPFAETTSGSGLSALWRDCIEGSLIANEHCTLPRVLLKSAHDAVRVFWINLHEPCSTTAALTRDKRRARTSEKIRDDVSGLAAVQQCAFDQLNRFSRRMNPVRRGFLFFPQSRLCFIAVPRVLLAGDVAIEQGLVAKFVATKSPRECVLCPNDLAPNREARGFECILKLPLPGRRVAHVQRSAWLHRGTQPAEGAVQELFEVRI